MPESFDLYTNWQEPTNREDPLTAYQRALILSAFSDDAEILEVKPARSWSFYPLRIEVATDESSQTVFLRKDPKIGGLELEAELLPTLSALGLPVPRLLADPAVDPDSQDLVPVTIISSVPGESLLDFSWNAQGNDAYIAMQLVIEGVARLHNLTAALQQEAVASKIPTKTLMGELEEIQGRGGRWLEVKEFQQALEQLEKRLPVIEIPLAFSNGDYNPGNFLFLYLTNQTMRI